MAYDIPVSPPPAFSKDILARFLCWHIQEQAFGGLDPKTAKHLGSFARGDRSRADRPRRLKPGTVLLREYQGERHTVTVVANGYVWREATYASLLPFCSSVRPLRRSPRIHIWSGRASSPATTAWGNRKDTKPMRSIPSARACSAFFRCINAKSV